jgi:transcriptional regulator with XRE-family HTH domain
MLFGNKIKELRDEQGLLQRQLAAFLEIDTPMFSKIERGDRRAKREQVIKLAEYLHQDEKDICIKMRKKCLPYGYHTSSLMLLMMNKNVTCATMRVLLHSKE